MPRIKAMSINQDISSQQLILGKDLALSCFILPPMQKYAVLELNTRNRNVKAGKKKRNLEETNQLLKQSNPLNLPNEIFADEMRIIRNPYHYFPIRRSGNGAETLAPMTQIATTTTLRFV